MATKVVVSNVSEYGLLPDGTKPLPEPLFTLDYCYAYQCNITENSQEMLENIIIPNPPLQIHIYINQWSLLLTWFKFHPSMDK